MDRREAFQIAVEAAHFVADRLAENRDSISTLCKRLLCLADWCLPNKPSPEAAKQFMEAVGIENGQTATVQATIPADTRPRCEVCGWTLADSAHDGCVPGNCSYGRRIAKRRAELAKKQGAAQADEFNKWPSPFCEPGEAKQSESIYAQAAVTKKPGATTSGKLWWNDTAHDSQSDCGRYEIEPTVNGYMVAFYRDPGDDDVTEAAGPFARIEAAKAWCEAHAAKEELETARCERCKMPMDARGTRCTACVKSDGQTLPIEGELVNGQKVKVAENEIPF